MDDQAVIYTYTIIYSSTEAFKDKTPYVAAIVEKAGGEKVATIVEGYRENIPIAIGMPVVFARTDATGNPVYRFPG
jgi:uncharacterized OB-fold protein